MKNWQLSPPKSVRASPACFATADTFDGVGGASIFTYSTLSISRPMRASNAGGIATWVMRGASCTMIGMPTAAEIAWK